jgi:hypothetical protein
MGRNFGGNPATRYRSGRRPSAELVVHLEDCLTHQIPQQVIGGKTVTKRPNARLLPSSSGQGPCSVASTLIRKNVIHSAVATIPIRIFFVIAAPSIQVQHKKQVLAVNERRQRRPSGGYYRYALY